MLTPLDICDTASAGGDITGALKTPPNKTGGGNGWFVVRGGTARKQDYIDGNLVNNFFYSSLPGIASRGRFNPFLFKGRSQRGGYSRYTARHSLCIDPESTDLPEKTEATFL